MKRLIQMWTGAALVAGLLAVMVIPVEASTEFLACRPTANGQLGGSIPDEKFETLSNYLFQIPAGCSTTEVSDGHENVRSWGISGRNQHENHVSTPRAATGAPGRHLAAEGA